MLSLGKGLQPPLQAAAGIAPISVFQVKVNAEEPHLAAFTKSLLNRLNQNLSLAGLVGTLVQAQKSNVEFLRIRYLRVDA